MAASGTSLTQDVAGISASWLQTNPAGSVSVPRSHACSPRALAAPMLTCDSHVWLLTPVCPLPPGSDWGESSSTIIASLNTTGKVPTSVALLNAAINKHFTAFPAAPGKVPFGVSGPYSSNLPSSLTCSHLSVGVPFANMTTDHRSRITTHHRTTRECT